MESILSRLPDPASLDDVADPFLEALDDLSNTVSGKVAGFAPDFASDFADLLEAGGELPIPSQFDLVEEPLLTLQQMLASLPSDPQELTGTATAALDALKGEVTELGGALAPLSATLDLLLPLLEHAELLGDSVSRTNTLLDDLSSGLTDLDMSDLGAQIELLLQVFDAFPETAGASPLAELKEQVETFKAWLTLDPAALTEHFRGHIETLAEALPGRLDQVVDAGLAPVAQVESSLATLDPSAWLTPLDDALAGVEDVDLEDLGAITGDIAALDAALADIPTTAGDAADAAGRALGALSGFHAGAFLQELRGAWMSALDAVAPQAASPLGRIFRELRGTIDAFDASALQVTAEELAQLTEERVEEIDGDRLTAALEEIRTRLTGVVDTMDRALVEVATTLSSLATRLEELIAGLDLSGLSSRIKDAFTALTGAAGGLESQAAGLRQVVAAFFDQVEIRLGEIDGENLASKVGERLQQLIAVLGDPRVRSVLLEAKDGIDQVAANLEGVSLKPVFDRVVNESETLERQLAEVDVSELNALLKAALKAALDILRAIDFSTMVAAKLEAQLQSILVDTSDLVAPLGEAYNAVDERVTRFDPAELVAGKLAAPFEALAAGAEQIDPAAVLEPLEDLSGFLVAQVEALDPSSLIEPLTALHDRLTTALGELDPAALVAPMNQLLEEVKGLLDELGLTELLGQVTGALSRAEALLSDLSFGDQLPGAPIFETLEELPLVGGEVLDQAAAGVDSFLDQLVANLTDVDMAVLAPALDALEAAAGTVEGHLTESAVLDRLGGVATTLGGHDVPGRLTGLTRRWLAQKQRFAAFTPQPEDAADFDELKARVFALSPIALLATPSRRIAELEEVTAATVTELEAGRAGLAALVAEDRDRLAALLPAAATAEDFRDLVRQGLDDELGQPVKDLLEDLGGHLEELAGTFEPMRGAMLRLRSPFTAIFTLPASVGAIGDAVTAIQERVAGLDLSFLEEELQGVIDRVKDQLGNLPLEEVLGAITAAHAAVVEQVGNLYPAAEAERLGQAFQLQVVDKLELLHPDKTVAEPLRVTYQDVLELRDELDVGRLFEAVTGKLETLEEEIDEGLDRSARAFDGLLSALPL